MYLLDTNVLTHYVNGHQTLLANLQRVDPAEVALPSVVVAEAMRGRSEFALKAPPDKAAYAHALLLETWQILQTFSDADFGRIRRDQVGGIAKTAQFQQAVRRYDDCGDSVVWETHRRHAQPKAFC